MPRPSTSYCSTRVGGVGGKITSIGATPGGGTNLMCKPDGAGDTTVECAFLSQAGRLRVGDGSAANTILEVKDRSTNFVLSSPTLTQNEVFATKAAVSNFTPNNPTGTSSTTDVMMGLGSTLTFTAKVHGRVRVACNFNMANTGSGNGAFATIYRGTGTAPTNGTAVTGTQTGGGRTYTAIANNQQIGVSLEAWPTLTVGVATWFDIALRSVTGGTSTITSTQCSITEI